MPNSANTPWIRSLSFRIAGVLSLALVPIGSIAIYQTNQVSSQAEEVTRLSLLALTQQGVEGERSVLQQAFGAASALAKSVQVNTPDDAACSKMMADFNEEMPRFSLAAYIPIDGVIRCGSAGIGADVSQRPNHLFVISEQKPTVQVATDGPVSKTSVLVVSQPVFIDGKYTGYIAISVPHSNLKLEQSAGFGAAPKDIMTFNGSGKILTSTTGLETAESVLPIRSTLEEMAGLSPIVFSGQSRNGADQLYVVVPVVENQVFALGIWPSVSEMSETVKAPVILFPLLMWIASVVVGLVAIDRMAGRHIRMLSRRMRRFERVRTFEDNRTMRYAAEELRHMEQDFILMAETILHDQAELENAVRQRNVLLKEVHHRVKNNLQLISSIMNMNIRKAHSPETKAILSRLQDRVLAMASIHRNLHQVEQQGQVNVGALVREVANQTLQASASGGHRIRVKMEIQDVILYPDQAVPLSLLASELMANAAKYTSNDNGEPWLTLSLVQEGNRARLQMVNSKGKVLREPAEGESTGLGKQLIRAFATQLGSRIETEESETEYRAFVSFEVLSFQPEALDY
ncbi:histidine kinase dimerization/phosphoacceptor domain -containing protein [Pseudooceanicola spongiae]|uniref:histidine kinase n=1 Tax=Pseudooceanicola spongiae TaxID=2613965 RepID=A0A7L9WI27_9RHOB|nr:histidine kinase dimerization/phosphoacceptor domain -containing protein [Pseudooceanicola spongiae]QOL79454.1 sensor histidine kinase [Pseudooceanicola spongiae]